MGMSEKYIVLPAYVARKKDCGLRYISTIKLINLYNVNPKECILIPGLGVKRFKQGIAGYKGRFKVLTSCSDGSYDLSKCEEIEL